MSLPINSLYSLTWGDYGTSLVSAVQLLRCHGDLVDCTLAAGGRSFPAHKIVLCAASPFLLDLLKNTPCKHPVVMLAGVNANDLESLLEFVYRGEVSVDHSQLPSLLQAAHCLNIQGLAPQTVTKDDYTTSIQLQGLIPQHHVKAVIDVGNGTLVSEGEELITHVHQEQPQTVQAQVVEEIITDVSDVKDVISQLLPSRKRKPRVKKSHNSSKIIKTQENQTVSTQSINESDLIEEIEIKETQIIEQHQPQQQPQQQQQQQPQIQQQQPKTPQVVQTIAADGTPIKPKSRSQSEQPASCPICGAIIRQSRNLRRHLELRHFSKPGAKKERKSKEEKSSPTIQTVQIKKEPVDTPSTSGGTISLSIANPDGTEQQQLIDTSSLNGNDQQQTQQIVTQTENTDGTTSLSIAHVQTLQGHQLTLGNLNQD